VRLKKQRLIMEIERLYDIAMRDIDLQCKLKQDQIEEKEREAEE